jgi:S1-C subfamily serine protease
VYLPKLSLSVLAALFLFVQPAAAQVGIDSGLWEFVEPAGIETSLVIVRGDQNGGTGTGCVIRGEQLPEVLTAAHVVDGNNTLTVSFHDGSAKRGIILRFDRDADVATVQCDTPEGCSVLEVADDVAEGDEVRVCGFGGGQALRCFKTKVAAVGEQSSILFSYAIPGDSGGPVVNAAGKVCGVVSGGSIWAKKKVKTVAGTVHSVTAPIRCGSVAAVRRLLRR